MVSVNELLDQFGAKIGQIISRLKQDVPELEAEHIAPLVLEILETFQEMRESFQPVHHHFNGLHLEHIPEFCIVSQKSLNSQEPEEEVELVETVSSRNRLEADNYKYQGVLQPSRAKQVETIWEWLNNDRVGTIVIEGEDGMGKKWMTRQLKDRAIATNLFDIIIWMDLNQKSILESQEYIVDQLGLSIMRETHEKVYNKDDLMQAVALSLGKKKYLLIVNDFAFNKTDIEDLGFSEPWKQNVSSKVLISGPKKYMDTIEKDKICRVEPLEDDIALLLFLEITGLDISSPHIIEIVKPLVASFKGSPSKIVSCGGDAAELINGICQLLNSGKMELIDCLLSCFNLPIYHRNIQVKDLITWWIVDILVDDCLGLEKAYEKAQHILQELIDAQFLERDETHVWLNTVLVRPLRVDSFIPLWMFKDKISCAMNEIFKFKGSDKDEWEVETTELLIYGKEANLPRGIPADLFIQKMPKLHTLAILNAGIVSLHKSLSNLKHLEILIIRGCSSLKNLDPIRGLQKLERLCISGASSLKEIPDDIFTNIDKLAELDLSNNQLKQLPFSFMNLGKIRNLILHGCSRLESIPSMEAFYKLSVLDLSGASSLTSIPDTSYQIKTLDLSGTLIESLPSPSNLKQAVQLFLRGCTKITTMPHPARYQNLEVLDLSNSTSFREFKGQSDQYYLKTLDLSGTLIAEGLPFVGFDIITNLLLRNCCHLQTMPPLPIKIELLDLSGSIAFMNFHDASLPDHLRNLDLSRTQIGKLPVLSTHSVMVQLILKECGLLEELPHLELQRLQVLDLSGSTKFKKFTDDSFDKLQKLRTLNLSETQVANLPTFSQCSEIRQLILRKCLKLEELPHLNTLEKLELLDLSGSISFKHFKDESFGKKEVLHELNLSETRVIQIPSLSECNNLRKLILGGCSKLEILPNLKALSKLVVLDLSGMPLIKFHYQSTGLKYYYLQVLDLSGIQVLDLSFISGCLDLRQLSLRDCPNIFAMPPLDELTHLEELDISRTETTELSFLSRCKSLCQLLLNDCSNVQELTPLKEHTRLEVLDLSRTKAEDFSLLSGFNKLRELSLRGCLNLETLSFEGLHNLQKVDLSHTPIKMLPSSFFQLRNLQTLLLADCSSLETLPHMEFVPKLEVLDLSCTNVREFPKGILALTHLRFLKLQEENSLWKFNDGKSFEKFHFCLFATKEQIGENDIYLQGQHYSFKDIYYQTCHIPSITEEPDKFFKICGFQTFPIGIEEVLLHVELLYLKKNNFLTRLSDLGAENVKNMRECWIENCDIMETVFYGEEVDENVALGRCLRNLWVSKLPELKSLFGGVVQPGSFTFLKHLYIECCPSLVAVFSSRLELKNLEVLKIKFCDKIEGIYGETVLGENTLPSLKTLILLKLPELQSICGGVLLSIRSLRVVGCKKLKKLPVSGNRTCSRVKVKGEAVWWNDLEWDDNDIKSQLHFSPF